MSALRTSAPGPKPRWLGGQDQLQAGYMVVRIWHDGRAEDVAGPTDRHAALSLARTQARLERTVYLRAPDDMPLDQPGPVLEPTSIGIYAFYYYPYHINHDFGDKVPGPIRSADDWFQVEGLQWDA